MPNPGLVSVILLTYNRRPLLAEAIDALQRQTYGNLEIIVINNGSTDGTVDYLSQLEASDDRIKLVHFEENQFSLDDPNKPYAVCTNAGLEIATGDYVMFHADDDFLSDNYFQKIVALFEDNSECASAIGLPRSFGNVVDEDPRLENYRPRYMPGHLLASDVVRGGITLFYGSAMMFTVKREALVEAGGFHRAIDMCLLSGIVPFGVTGFDDTAIYNWLRIRGRMDTGVARTLARARDTSDMMKKWEIQRRWQIFGDSVARRFVSDLELRSDSWAAAMCLRFVYSLHCIRAFQVLRSYGRRRRFWMALPGNTLQWDYFFSLARLWAGRLARFVFHVLPGVARLSPRIARLKQRLESSGKGVSE